MSRRETSNFAKIVDQAIAAYGSMDTDTRKPYSLIHGMNNLHVSPMGRKRASSFKKPKAQPFDSSGNPGEMRPRTCSMPTRNTFRKPRLLGHDALHLDSDNEIYRLRSFSTTSKGIIVNTGDSFRSRSTSSVYSSGSEQYPLSPSSRTSSSHSRDSFGIGPPTVPFSVTVLGAPGVGKTALTQQFMTSEYLGGFDTSIGECIFITGLKLCIYEVFEEVLKTKRIKS